MTDKINLEEVAKVLKKVARRYHNDGTHDVDDLFQEGLIHAWKVVESGDYNDFHHVVNKAKVAIRKRVSERSIRAFGAPPLSQEAYTRESPNREKVFQYIQSHLDLHNAWPTSHQISQATGVYQTGCSRYLKSFREGRYSHATYTVRSNGDRRISEDYFKNNTPLDAIENLDRASFVRVESFEEDLISQDAAVQLLKAVPTPHDKILCMRYLEGWTQAEIGAYFNPESKDHQQVGFNRVTRALEWFKWVHFPHLVKNNFCKNGHEYTRENTEIRTDRHGTTSKLCVRCKEDRRANLKKYAKKNLEKIAEKKRLSPLCPKGHDDWAYKNKSCARYCRTCNTERSKAYRDAKKNAG